MGTLSLAMAAPSYGGPSPDHTAAAASVAATTTTLLLLLLLLLQL